MTPILVAAIIAFGPNQTTALVPARMCGLHFPAVWMPAGQPEVAAEFRVICKRGAPE